MKRADVIWLCCQKKYFEATLDNVTEGARSKKKPLYKLVKGCNMNYGSDRRWRPDPTRVLRPEDIPQPKGKVFRGIVGLDDK